MKLIAIFYISLVLVMTIIFATFNAYSVIINYHYGSTLLPLSLSLILVFLSGAMLTLLGSVLLSWACCGKMTC